MNEHLPHNRYTSGPAIVLYIAGAKLLLHLLSAGRYGERYDKFMHHER